MHGKHRRKLRDDEQLVMNMALGVFVMPLEGFALGSRRRFQSTDVLALTAAFLLASVYSWLGIGSSYPRLIATEDASPVTLANSSHTFSAYLLWWTDLAVPYLVAFAFTLAGLRWVPPRSKRPRLYYQPGFLAVLILSASTLIAFLIWSCWAFPAILLEFLDGGVHPPLPAKNPTPAPIFDSTFLLLLVMTTFAGFAVAISWISLIATRRWKPEADWIDRSGRVLGVLAVIFAPLSIWFWYGLNRG